MELKNFNAYFFIVLLVGVSIITYFVLQPFLLAIGIAAILAVTFHGPQKFFERIVGKRRHFAALLTSIMAVSLFIALFAIVIGLVVKEAADLYQEIAQGDSFLANTQNILNSIQGSPFGKYFGLGSGIDPQMISNIATSAANYVFLIGQKAYQGVAHFMFISFVVFFTLYYLLIGGKNLVKRIMHLSPLRNEHEKLLVDKFISISMATIKGSLVVGLAQGLLGGFLFAAVGIPSAAVWGILMAFLSLIPMFGASIIWFPAGIILLLMGNIWQGLIVLAFGGLVISLIDNFLRPKLVGKDTQMHPLLVFFATLGGISLFGFFGFIIGPLVVAIFLALWEIYAVEFKQQLGKYNK